MGIVASGKDCRAPRPGALLGVVVGIMLALLSRTGSGSAFAETSASEPPNEPHPTDALHPLDAVPGKPISEEEANRLLDSLRGRLNVPWERIERLKCEFVPRFVDFTESLRANAVRHSEGEALPSDLKVGSFDGFYFMPFLVDNGLSGARKAVLYYQNPETERPRRNIGNVILYDEAGKPIPLHAAIGPALAIPALHHLGIMGRAPFWMVKPDKRFEVFWLLDSPPGAAHTLYMVYHAVAPPGTSEKEAGDRESWSLSKVAFRPGPEPTPLSAGTAIWDTDRKQEWSPQDWCEYGALGGSGAVGIVKSGPGSKTTEYEWGEFNGNWVVTHVKGMRPDLGERRMTPWEITFTGFDLEAEIPPGLLEWPKAQQVKMDFSSPDATAETILSCLRTGRKDLLNYCRVNPPEGPLPTEYGPSMEAYWFDELPYMREGLRILDKRPEDPNWIYTISIPQPATAHRRSFDLLLVPEGDTWRMDVDIGLLLFQFWD